MNVACQEFRMKLSRPPAEQGPTAQAQQKAWKEAVQLLDSARGAATWDMHCHDNDYGAVGNYDQDHRIGVMKYRDRRPDVCTDVSGYSRKLRLPNHFWQHKKYETVVTDHVHTTTHKDGTVGFQREYHAALSSGKFPQVVWEGASQTQSNGTGNPLSIIQVEANYRDDVLVWRSGPY